MRDLLIICLIVLFIYLNKFSNKRKNKQLQIPLPSVKPLMFGRISCPYTVKMIDELKKHKVFSKFEYVNTETKYGAQLMQHHGGEGVPFFVHKSRKGHGFMPKSKLFEKLNL